MLAVELRGKSARVGVRSSWVVRAMLLAAAMALTVGGWQKSAAAADSTGSAPAGQPAAAAKSSDYVIYKEFGGVMLILYSIAGVALIAERLLSWLKVKRQSAATTVQMQELLAKPDRAQLKAAMAKSSSPLGNVLYYVLKHDVTNSPETTQLLLDDALDAMQSRFKKNLALLAALAGTAPFMGLFGTVLGIMKTFAAIAESGIGGTHVISAGISQALIATAVGLGVAIPTFIAYNLFTIKANETTRVLRQQANRILVALGDI